MIKRPTRPKEWVAITTTDGAHRGRYEVSGGMITVVYDGGGRVTTGASGADANEGLARLILSELVGKARAGH